MKSCLVGCDCGFDVVWECVAMYAMPMCMCRYYTLSLFVLEGYVQVLFVCYSSPLSLPRGINDYVDDLTN